MDVVDAARVQPVALELRVQPLHVVRREPFQAVRAEAGDQVIVHVDPVAEVGVLGDVRRRGDVLDPVGQPPADRPPLPALRTVPWSRSRSRARTFSATSLRVLPPT